MKITYTEYPFLLLLSYNKDNAPAELPLISENENARTFQVNSKGFQDLLGYFPAMNTLYPETKTKHYYLLDNILHQIDGFDPFRNLHYNNFFSNYIKAERSIALMRGGGEYIFYLLGKHESKTIKNVNGRYIAVALFSQNLFLGFEEGVITEKGVEVMNTGYYGGPGMDIGGYISFVLILLGYLSTKNQLRLVEPEINLTTEEVLYVD